MEIAMQKFPKGLPTLEELKKFNSPDVPPETAWIWGDKDEVILEISAPVNCSSDKVDRLAV
jgi:hypothetical protein